MAETLLGDGYSLAAAVTWAVALVLFKYSGERVSPLALNLFKCAVGLVFLGLTLVVIELFPATFAGERYVVVAERPLKHIVILCISGVIGIALADTLFFHALNRLGVGLTSIIDCTYSPFVLFFSWLMLTEELTWVHLIGTALVVSGVAVSTRHDPPPGRTPRDILTGMLAGVTALGCMGFGIVLAKPTLEDFPLIWASTIRLAAGTIALAAFCLLLTKEKRPFAVFRPSRAWKTAIPGAFLGTYLAYVFWVGGFKYAHPAVSAILNQTSVIFAIILATVIVREPLTKRKMLAVSLGVLGILVVLSEEIVTLVRG